LTNVGARRSAAWLKAHFIEPQALSPGSVMPSYAHLFKDRRGDDLVNFLKQSGIETAVSTMQTQAQWVPEKSSVEYDAKAIYSRHCAVCHGENGNGNGLLANQLPMPPTDLKNGPFIRTQATGDPSLAIARVIKFGVVGSEMPGHETLGSGSILSLSEMLTQWRRDSANPQ
jgi:cytochrome c oxidase cbb3-type subunit 2